MTAWFSSSFLGTPIRSSRSVRHDEERASLRRVLKRPSEPSCETEKSLSVGCSAARVLRLLSALQVRKSMECSHHVPRLSRTACSQEWTLLRTCSRSASVRTPISLRSIAHVERHWICARSHPRGIQQKVACQYGQWCGHQFLCSCLVQHLLDNNSRANEVKKPFTRTTWTNVCKVSHQQRPFANKVMEPQRRAGTNTREGLPPEHRADTSNTLFHSTFQT